MEFTYLRPQVFFLNYNRFGITVLKIYVYLYIIKVWKNISAFVNKKR